MGGRGIGMVDKMEVEILEDGEIRIETEGISGVNHCSADEFLKEVEELAGGRRVVKKTRRGHVHLREKVVVRNGY